MSYEKAMRHARNPRKGRNMHLGFDTGSGKWPSVYASPCACFFKLNDAFRERHRGDREAARNAIKSLLQQCRDYRLAELAPDVVTIRVPPSFEEARKLSGEWYRFEHFGGALSSDRAQHIAAKLTAVSLAKRGGKFMWKDWGKAHPSLPYQMGGLADRINAHPIVTGANRSICFDFELKEA